MAEGKFDLPDDLLSAKPSDQAWTAPKVEASGGNDEEKVLMGGLLDESKDQAASESSIPLSPQWLYAKPTEPKMEMRAPTSVSLGNSTDPIQKEGWRLDGSEGKDWRRPITENESNRRWREEERETGLLGGRRDRRKAERRVDNVSIRETVETRALPSSDRWHDSRNSGHETRRDSKWSTRWGPEDKDKESRTEKKTDVEKEDAHDEKQSFVGSNRSASERDSDSRDKWRPRHRLEVHSGGSNSYRAAPGFGPERGRIEGSNLGFTLGRGRSNVIGRGSSAGPIGAANSEKSDSVPGRPCRSVDTFCYPRGKLLDIYRRQKLDPSFATMPDKMEESLPITQVGIIEPLALVAPDAEEEGILSSIWKGKITSSGVVYNSYRKGRSTENVTGIEDSELTEGNQGMPSTLTKETADGLREAATDDAYQVDDDSSFWKYGSQRNAVDEKDVKELEHKVIAANLGSDQDGLAPTVSQSNGVCGTIEIGDAHHSVSHPKIGENWQMADSDFTKHPQFHDIEFAASFDIRTKLPDDSSSLFVLPSSEQIQYSNTEANGLEMVTPSEEISLYYIDPEGNTQGPFPGDDIILWFEQGFFGLELPVCLADAPEGTPFQDLGEVMPYLKVRDGRANNTNSNSKLEQFGALGGQLEASLTASGSVLETDSSEVNDLRQPLPEFNSLSAKHVQSRASEPEVSLQLAHSEEQSFHNFVAQDEEIVFPGRPGNMDYSSIKSSGSICDPLTKSISHPSLPNEFTEPGVPNQNDNQLHPFGLLWSELEGHTTHAKLSVPSSMGRVAQFGALADPALAAETWPDVYRKNAVSDPNLYQDPMAAHHLSRMEQESNHLDLAQQLMAQQFQQHQLQQRNLLSHAHINEPVLEHVPSQNLIHHQQFANRSSPDLNNFLTLQLQQQRQLQLQQHNQLQQQQQFHQQQKLLQEQQQKLLQEQQQKLLLEQQQKLFQEQQQKLFQEQQQKLLQEQQQSQVRQVLLEQLLRNHMHDPGLGHSNTDQALLEQHLLHEMHQRSHHPPRHIDPSMEQLIQAKYGHMPQQEHQRDLFELISRAQHGQMPSLEQLLHQDQLQARQLSMGLRQRNNMEDERHIGSVWPADESDQFLRAHAGSHRAHSSGFGPLDVYQRQQRMSHEEQLSQLDRNLSLQERLRQGLYEPGSLPFERSISFPAGAPGMNLEAVNAMARAHGLDMQDSSARMQSAGQVGTFSSGIHSHNSHHPSVPNQFHASHLDTIDGRWSENMEQLENDWMESRIQKLHINAERQKREAEVKMISEDPSLWMSDGSNDEKSKQLLMELLHKKSVHHPSESLDVGNKTRAPSGLYSGPSSSDHAFSLLRDREAILNNSFAVGSYGSNSCETPHDEWASSLESNEIMPFRSDSRARVEGESLLVGIDETGQAIYTNSNMIGKSTVNNEFSEVEGRKRGSKSEGMIKSPAFEIQEGMVEQAGLAAVDRGEISINALSRQSSLVGKTGLCSDKIGSCNSFVEEVSKDWVPLPPKGQDNILLRRPPVSRTSSPQEGLSELVSDPVMRGKNSSSGASDGGRRDPGVNLSNQGSDITTSGKKDMRFRRTSSCSDADVPEASFMDMLKSNAKKTVPAEAHAAAGISESSDGTQRKKKGKKGRQIDPALLGFKVTSNRIMMGEIQRIDD